MTLPDPGEWPTEELLGERPTDHLPRATDLLAMRAAATPDATAVVDADRDERYTYGEADRQVAALSDRLDAAAGGRVALLLDTGLAFVCAFFAAGRVGATAVPLDPTLDDETLADRADRTAVDAVCAPESEAERADSIRPESAVVGVADAWDRSLDRTGPPDARDGSATGSDERVIVFTSGTTGEPKAVRLTRDNLVASAAGSAERLGVEPGDRWLVCLPTYHMGGLAPIVRSTLYGTAAVIQRRFDAAETVSLVERFGVTGISLVPTMLRRMLDGGWNPPERLRFALVGGAPAPEGLVERALERGVPLCPTYGTTETASQVATATPAEAATHPGTVGRPLANTVVTVVDDGTPAGEGEHGELAVDGPTVTPGYLDAEPPFGEHGLHTGDLGYRDGGGRLWITGRLDDRIVTGGENVDPERVADAVRALDGVEAAAVVGLPDEEWGERVAALVVADRSLTAEGLREALRDGLGDHEIPRSVAVAEELPRTASGTVDRDAVRDRLREDGS